MMLCIFKLCRWLREKGLCPMFIWSPVYDRWHRRANKWKRS